MWVYLIIFRIYSSFTNKKTIYTCLDEYFTKEKLQEELFCNICNCKKKSSKYYQIISLPNILIIYISFLKLILFLNNEIWKICI